MDHISIRNLGPIKEAELSIKKVNVFMGPQSCGKSTLVKAICHCRWIEKRVSFYGSTEGFDTQDKFREELIRYHRLSNEYFGPNTEIHYKGKFIEIKCWESKYIIKYNAEDSESKAYANSKLIYIPAERNFVSSVPNLTRYAEYRDNLLEFIYDWFDIKKYYGKESRLNLLNLKADFYHHETSDNNRIMLANGVDLPLANASSGLQSIVPLIVMVDYLAHGIYEDKTPVPYEKREKMLENVKEWLRRYSLRENQLSQDNAEELARIMHSNLYHFTQFFIEEPEQNLFPETQKELVYHLLRTSLYNPSRDHQLFLTTHSPFILYALNNSMLAWLVKDAPRTEESPQTPAINPSDVAIWEIHDGHLVSIQDTDGLVKDNYFDRIMKGVMDEFYRLFDNYEPVL